ncbi:MAG TPA: YetF domain-containing protein [Armatimonadota bacterium]|jgi:uncharacterized membrane protein YcaP (DUF421 family)
MTPSLLTVVGHTLTLYCFLILMLRVVGHRQLSQMTVVDLVVLVILGSSVETSLIAGNVSLRAGLTSAFTLLVADRVLGHGLARSGRLRTLVVGHPVLVVHEGRVLEERLRQVGMTHSDLMEGLRGRGFDDLPQVRWAVLEIDGSLNVIPMEARKSEDRPADDGAKDTGRPKPPSRPDTE